MARCAVGALEFRAAVKAATESAPRERDEAAAGAEAGAGADAEEDAGYRRETDSVGSGRY